MKPVKPVQYMQQVAGQARQITWPDRREVGIKFVVVLSISAFIAALLYGFDLGISYCIAKLKSFISS
jgi:preprotein translocase SecE subunit